ncbi:MAG: hypothetical protein LQ341_000297 [Variospora aurantia]|nr:MAG: hypothetical protein LQ341_000297 [Variospora aurantia]
MTGSKRRPAASETDSAAPPVKKAKAAGGKAKAAAATQPDSTEQGATGASALKHSKKGQVSESKLQERKNKAMINNPEYVFVIENNFESNIRELGGYLGMKTTQDLKDILQSDAAQAIVGPWLDSRAKGFGIGGCNDRSRWEHKKLFEILRLKKMRSWIKRPLPLGNGSDDIKLQDRGYVWWINTIHQLFEQFPVLAVDQTKGVPSEFPQYHGYTEEDWFRGYQLLRLAWRLKSREKGESKAQSQDCIEPTWLTPEDKLRKPGAVQAPQMSADNIERDARFDQARKDLAFDIREARKPGTTAEQMKWLEEFFQDLQKSARDSQTHDLMGHDKANNIRPPLAPHQLASLVAKFKDDTQILHPADPNSMIPSTEEIIRLGIEQTSTKGKSRAADPALGELVEAAISAEERPSDTSTDNEYLALTNRINLVSAVPPPYWEACLRLHIDPANPVLSLGHPDPLNPWQVQYVAWALEVEESLSGTLLADDMGLGKTRSALSLAVAAAIEAGAEVDTGIADKSDLNIDDTEQPAVPGVNASTQHDTAHVESAQGTAVDEPSEASENEDLEGDNEAGDDNETENKTLPSEKAKMPDALGESAPAPTQPKRGLTQQEKRERKFQECEYRVARIQQRQHLPVLVTFPSNGSNVWVSEIKRFPRLIKRSKNFFGSRHTGSAASRSMTLGSSIIDLLKYIESLPDTPEARLTLILTTYNTWVHRSIDYSKNKKARSVRRLKRGAEDDDLNDTTAEQERSAEESNDLRSYCPGVFSRVICDEAQRLKSPSTWTHKSIAFLNAPITQELTATPMMNRGVDLSGLLRYVYPPDAGSEETVTLADYEAARDALVGRQLSADIIHDYRRLLDPAVYYAITKTIQGQQLDAGTAYKVLPPILAIMYLRRTASTIIEDVNGQTVRVGEKIPHGEWISVELQRGPLETADYVPIYSSSAQCLGGGVDDETGEGRRNMAEHRRLSHATLHPGLDTLTTMRPNQVKDVNLWHSRFGDHGASMFFAATRHGPEYPIYRDRQSLAEYIGALSVKLRAVAIIAYEICVRQDRKLLVFCEWPITQWLVELWLANLSLPFIAIRSMHKLADRDHALERFNDPDDPAKGLVTSLAVGGTSSNMQHGGADVLYVDAWTNAQIAIQGSGRVLRMGQERKCTFYSLVTNHSYDQVLSAASTRKYVPIIAGQADVGPDEVALARWKSANALDLNPEALQEFKDASITDAASHLYQLLLGQRSNRYQWTSKNLALKDTLAEESAFMKLKNIPPPPPGLMVEDLYTVIRSTPKKTDGSAGLIDDDQDNVQENVEDVPTPSLSRQVNIARRQTEKENKRLQAAEKSAARAALRVQKGSAKAAAGGHRVPKSTAKVDLADDEDSSSGLSTLPASEPSPSQRPSSPKVAKKSQSSRGRRGRQGRGRAPTRRNPPRGAKPSTGESGAGTEGFDGDDLVS